ncbi:replication factor C small subunit [Candidatus Woesearchaeota archaeon]|nr:replication factor C small subunit [Candidatus Woesearchaeota archaeon]
MAQDDFAIWTEKYRPKIFSEVRGQKEIVQRVKALAEQGSMPHLLFAGPPGTGKSTLALVIARSLFGDNWHQHFIELNASDERGIDVIRVKVKDFARTRPIGDVPFKVIFLDECDALTREAQQALRRTMEIYTQHTRFILSANYSSKIIEPIQSRCAVFRFKPLSEKEMAQIVEHIAKEENLAIDGDAMKAIVEIAEGDCRRLETLLQGCAAMGSKISRESLYSLASVAEPKEVNQFLLLALAGKFADARSKMLDTMLKYGLSGIDLIKQIQKEILLLPVADRGKMRLIEKCGETEFRLSEGSDEFIQLEALLAQVALAKEEPLKA